MRKDVYQYLQSNEELLQFIRIQPKWYREISRNPNRLENLRTEAMNYYGKTIPHKISTVTNSLQMASMMYQMFQGEDKTNKN